MKLSLFVNKITGDWLVSRCCNVGCVKVTDRFTCSELRERLGVDDIVTVIQCTV